MRSPLAAGDRFDELGQRPHTAAVGLAVEIGLIHKDAAQPGGSRADHIDVVQVPDVNGGVAARAEQAD